MAGATPLLRTEKQRFACVGPSVAAVLRQKQREEVGSVEKPEEQEGELAHKLSARHIQFIALGGAIGAGLFLGSGEAIALAGPIVLVIYLIAGLVVFFMARAMGELTLNRPPSSSFTAHVDDLVGHWPGFVSGWSYWLIWVLVGIAEITAVGIFVKFWFPDFPQWLSSLITVAVLYSVNRTAVKWFGEIEFWLTLIKIVAISAVIVGGIAIAAGWLEIPGAEPGISNFWRHGGIAPHGYLAVLAAAPAALFSFGGTELIGVTAAEAKDPEKSVPRAVNGVVFRILLFYVGSLGVIMTIVPWSQLSGDESPFVQALELTGLSSAAGVINFVVLTAVISSCNSGIYATGRLLLSLAEKGQAPSFFRKIDRRRLPANGITASSGAMLVGVALNYLFPDKVFGYVMSLVAALLLWTWLMILVAHFVWRRKHREGAPILFAMPLHPISSIFSLTFIIGVGLLLFLNPDTRITAYAAACWFAVATIAYFAAGRPGKKASGDVDLKGRSSKRPLPH